MIRSLIAGILVLFALEASAIGSGLTPHTSLKLRSAHFKFEPNVGQSTAASADFISTSGRYELLLSPNQATFVDSTLGSALALGFELMGTNDSVAGVGRQRLASVTNYLRGPSSGWLKGIPNFGQVQYSGVYRGIDLLYYASEKQLEFDFVVAPGARPREIRLRLFGGNPRYDSTGIVVNGHGVMACFHSPRAYQIIAGRRTPVSSEWKLASGILTLKLGKYDRSRELIVDPIVTYVRFLPLTARGQMPIAVDSADSIYLSTSDTVNSVSNIEKYSSDGTLVYSTVVSGDIWDMKLDAQGNLYLAGDDSLGCGALGFDPGFTCGNALVLELDPTGQNVLFSLSFGGHLGETARSIAVDTDGMIYATGTTASADLPVVNASQSTPNPILGSIPCGTGTFCPTSGFLAKIDPDKKAIVFLTFIGDASSAIGGDIAIDSAHALHVLGSTITSNSQFIAKFDNHGFPISTMPLNATGTFHPTALTIDKEGNFIWVEYEYPGLASEVHKIDSAGAELFTWRFSSRVPLNYGGNPTQAYKLGLDANNDIYFCGWTQAVDLPVLNSVQSELVGLMNAFVSKLSPTGDMLFSTYLGGDFDQATSVAVDSKDAVYVGGVTNSASFPWVDGQIPTFHGSGPGMFLVKIDPATSANLVLNPNRIDFGGQLAGTVGAKRTISVTNNGSSAITFNNVSFLDSLSDFTLVNGCGNGLAIGASCTVDISFSPHFAGSSYTTLTFTGSFGRAGVGLIGLGEATGESAMRISPQVYPPAAHAVPGLTAAAGVIQITNVGAQPLSLQNIQLTSEFTQTNNCPPSVATAATCQIFVTFAPSGTGDRSGTMTITPNNSNGPQNVDLHGVGDDFMLSADKSQATLQAGDSVITQLTITPQYTGLNAPVSLSCAGLPANSKCTFFSVQLTPGPYQVATHLTITTAQTKMATRILPVQAYAAFLVIFGVLLVGPKQNRKHGPLLLVFLLVIMAAYIGCGGNNIQSPPQPPFVSGTPSGTYKISIAGVAGNLTHSTQITLIVN
jgi:hypothetical protein